MIHRDFDIFIKNLNRPVAPALAKKIFILIACQLGATAVLYFVLSYLTVGH